MIVECPACNTIFPVDPKKVPTGGINARCSVCSEVFFVAPPEPEAEAIEPSEAIETEVEVSEPLHRRATPSRNRWKIRSKRFPRKLSRPMRKPSRVDGALRGRSRSQSLKSRRNRPSRSMRSTFETGDGADPGGRRGPGGSRPETTFEPEPSLREAKPSR